MPGNKQLFSAAMNAADRHRWDSHWTEALQDYQRALTEFPEDTTARSGLGFCYMQTKQWQKALTAYAYVLQSDPSNIIALSKTAELYGILNRRDDAYHAYLHLADLYAQAGQGARAEAAWQKAVQLSPSDPKPYERLAGYYFEKKDIAQMIMQRLAAARAYLLRNELIPAQLQCEEVLRADRTNSQAQQLLMHILSSGQGQVVGDGQQTALPRTSTGALNSSSAVRQDSGADSSAKPEQRDNIPLSPSDPSASSDQPAADTVRNISGGNSGIMGNMGSAGNYSGNPGPSSTMAGNSPGMQSAPQTRITSSQVTGALQQAQLYQNQGRFNDAINLCEQILQSGFDRPDARYFLGWLYQEQQRWDEAIQQFQHLLNDADYALSCYYALGQCYRARGDLRTATVHFDEAVDRVNLDALTVEESDQLVQLCQEAAEAHRLLGEQEQALTVYNALLGFLRSRGWNDKVSQVEYMLQQAQNAPAPSASPAKRPEQAGMHSQVPEAPTMEFNTANVAQAAQQSAQTSAAGDLPDWLTGILNDSEKTQAAKKSAQPVTPPPPPVQPQPKPVVEQPPVVPQQQQPPMPEPAPPTAQVSIPSWLTEEAKPNATRVLPPEQMPYEISGQQVAQVQPPLQAPSVPVSPQAPVAPPPVAPIPPAQVPVQNSSYLSGALPPQQAPVAMDAMALQVPPASSAPAQEARPAFEELLGQIGTTGQNANVQGVAETLIASTAYLPEDIRMQVVRSMQDIQKYVNHGLLTPATDECLKVINIAPQYLDVHQVLCEIYVRQGKLEQAITKYAILVDTYIANGRIDDAIATYRRILQLEPNNITYRMRLINLLSSQGNKEDLLRERTLAAESYLRLGYMDRAIAELEQALQENPTNIPTRLNYALALQKLGRTQQAIAEYQRVLQIDPRHLMALMRWHVAMIASQSSPRSTTLEVLSRIRWQLRGEGQKHADMVLREYLQAVDLQPNNADVHYALGSIYHQCGQYDRAIDSYCLAMRDNTVDVLARASAAQALLSQGKPEAAIQHLEQALQTVRRTPTVVDPATWAARPREDGEQHQAPEMEITSQLANAYGRTGRQDQMQALLNQVKQVKPVEDEVSSTLADISHRQGDVEATLVEYMDMVRHYRTSRQIDNALSMLNEMVRLAPQDARAHEELADIYIKRGQLEEGIAEMRLLADIRLRKNQLSEAGEVLHQIGSIYAEMGDNEEALTSLFRAAELNPSSVELQREIVGYCLQLGRNEEAARYQGLIARHYFETDQVKEAVAALQQLITIDRANYEAYDMLGQTYQSVGEYEQASRVYRNLAKMNPSSSVARERLATLQELRTR
jgi:tetratricopeptide (TPR) repeat protein